jgi:hypothetical protein
MGMVAPQSIEEATSQADVIVIGRLIGAQHWTDPLYAEPESQSVLWVATSQVLKGNPKFQEPGVIAINILGEPPDETVADLDHLLLLAELSADDPVYYLRDGYMSIYANVDGKVVTPEYAEIKRLYRHSMFATALDGTPFDALVDRVSDGPTTTTLGRPLAVRGYFAC